MVVVLLLLDASRQGEPSEAVYGGLKAATNSFMKTIAKKMGILIFVVTVFALPKAKIIYRAKVSN